MLTQLGNLPILRLVRKVDKRPFPQPPQSNPQLPANPFNPNANPFQNPLAPNAPSFAPSPNQPSNPPNPFAPQNNLSGWPNSGTSFPALAWSSTTFNPPTQPAVPFAGPAPTFGAAAPAFGSAAPSSLFGAQPAHSGAAPKDNQATSGVF